MSVDSNRVGVQVTCPHGVRASGDRRYVLRQYRPSGGFVETSFYADRSLTLSAAVWQVEGRAPFQHEVERKWWELQRDEAPGFSTVGARFKQLVEWTGPAQTAGVCDLCALDEVKERW